MLNYKGAVDVDLVKGTRPKCVLQKDARTMTMEDELLTDMRAHGRTDGNSDSNIALCLGSSGRTNVEMQQEK